MRLPEQIVELHAALGRAGVPHAFGGAVALAYATLDPRGTSDIDVNVFVAAGRAGPALAALPAGVERPPGTAERIARDGQVRLWWDGTPVDLFFDYAPIHRDAARHARRVPFEDVTLPVLGPVELATFKAMFARSQDWVDIERMVAARALDVGAVREALGRMLDAGDERFARLDDAARRGSVP